MRNQILKQSQSGRTMLEMLGVLGIMGIIMYGAIAGINYGMSTYKINQTYNEVQEAIQAIQDLYSWNRRIYPTGEFTDKMCDNDIFTNCDGTQPKNPFGGDIKVEGIKDGDSFKVIYRSVENADCNRLKEMEWGSVLMDENSCSGTAVFCPKTRSGQTECSD